VNGEGAPLGGTGVKIVIVHVQVTSADRLRAESIEQGHFGPAGDAHWEFLYRQMLNQSRTGKKIRIKSLTIGVLERLLLLGRFGNDFNPLAVEDADILAVAVKHFHRQHEMLALVRVGNEQRLGRAITLQSKFPMNKKNSGIG
jgi:hypothetical protein